MPTNHYRSRPTCTFGWTLSFCNVTVLVGVQNISCCSFIKYLYGQRSSPNNVRLTLSAWLALLLARPIPHLNTPPPARARCLVWKDKGGGTSPLSPMLAMPLRGARLYSSIRNIALLVDSNLAFLSVHVHDCFMLWPSAVNNHSPVALVLYLQYEKGKKAC